MKLYVLLFAALAVMCVCMAQVMAGTSIELNGEYKPAVVLDISVKHSFPGTWELARGPNVLEDCLIVTTENNRNATIKVSAEKLSGKEGTLAEPVHIQSPDFELSAVSEPMVMWTPGARSTTYSISQLVTDQDLPGKYKTVITFEFVQEGG